MQELEAPVLLLKEETDARQGKNQIIANMEACEKVASMLESTLGPMGMDKLFFNETDLTITNDGATIMQKLDIAHPAARILKSISESQDASEGDGTTSVVLLASSIMKRLKPLIKENFEPQKIVSTLEKTLEFILETMNEEKTSLQNISPHTIAKTSLNSKILSEHKKLFSDIVVSAVTETERNSNIGIKKVPGAGIDKSFKVDGIAFEKCFTYAGYEQQKKLIENPKIAYLKIELEWKSEAENAEMRISGVEEYKKVVDAEWKIITDKLDTLVSSGANVVLSTLPIGDYATQYFAKHSIFSAGRVPEEDILRLIDTFGGKLLSTTGLIDEKSFGKCSLFEEKDIGKTRFNFFTSPPEILGAKRACTIILRGPGAVILSEVERSMHDALMVTRGILKHKEVVAGGGAFEMEISMKLREFSALFPSGPKFVVRAISEAFEIIPFQLSKNFGHDPTYVLQLLRKAHHKGEKFAGVSMDTFVCNTMKSAIIEPLQMKRHMVRAAFNAAISIVSVDSTIARSSKQ